MVKLNTIPAGVLLSLVLVMLPLIAMFTFEGISDAKCVLKGKFLTDRLSESRQAISMQTTPYSFAVHAA